MEMDLQHVDDDLSPSEIHTSYRWCRWGIWRDCFCLLSEVLLQRNGCVQTL